jgi:hypothetical protein
MRKSGNRRAFQRRHEAVAGRLFLWATTGVLDERALGCLPPGVRN